MKTLLIIAATLGATGVMAGAFGAHALRARLSPEHLNAFQVGVQYQLWHALAIFGIALLIGLKPGWPVAGAGWCLAVGVLLFSSSLYALALSGIGKLGIITPFGGLLMIGGWLWVAIAVARAPA